MHSDFSLQCNKSKISVVFNSHFCWLCFVTRQKSDPARCLTSITDVQTRIQTNYASICAQSRAFCNSLIYSSIPNAWGKLTSRNAVLTVSQLQHDFSDAQCPGPASTACWNWWQNPLKPPSLHEVRWFRAQPWVPTPLRALQHLTTDTPRSSKQRA